MLNLSVNKIVFTETTVRHINAKLLNLDWNCQTDGYLVHFLDQIEMLTKHLKLVICLSKLMFSFVPLCLKTLLSFFAFLKQNLNPSISFQVGPNMTMNTEKSLLSWSEGCGKLDSCPCLPTDASASICGWTLISWQMSMLEVTTVLTLANGTVTSGRHSKASHTNVLYFHCRVHCNGLH